MTPYCLEYMDVVDRYVTNVTVKKVFANTCAYTYFTFGKGGDYMAFWEKYKKFARDFPDMITRYEGKIEALTKTAKGKDAFDVTMFSPEGKLCKLSDYFGKFLYIDVWATWCGPCCAEIPYLEKLVAHFKGDDRVRFISISVDANKKAWLDKLEKEGLAIKSYGGAVINEDVSIDLPFNVRKNQNVTGKQKMAELAASLVKDGDHIFLDASTTAVFVAKALKEKERLTVITNSMEILLELADVSGWNIISTGGVMKEGYLAFLGSKTDESIRSYYVDKVIFSCKALDLEWGIMESQEAFGSTKRAMIGSGRKKILVVDSSKFDQTAFSVAGSMKEVDIIVTDKEPTERWKKHFEKFNVKCLYPV
jgi:DeoR/GlpR family transcriptional regulator of sugar metabolism